MHESFDNLRNALVTELNCACWHAIKTHQFQNAFATIMALDAIKLEDWSEAERIISDYDNTFSTTNRHLDELTGNEMGTDSFDPTDDNDKSLIVCSEGPK